MVLPLLVALPAAVGPLWLGGAGQGGGLLAVAFAVGLCGWLLLRAVLGYVPLPSGRILAWTALLCGLLAASARLSPTGFDGRALAVQLQALLLFPAVAVLSKDGRLWADQAIRVCAWTLAALAAYQRWALGDHSPASAFPDAGSWCAAVLLFLALAIERGDGLLGLALTACLVWSGDVGAWLGLFFALMWTGRWKRGAWPLAGTVGFFICLVCLYNKFGSAPMLQRWAWWKAAAAMALDRPVLGWGPGSFAQALRRVAPGAPAAGDPRNLLAQCAAEWGVPATALWLFGVLRAVAKGRSAKRLGALAFLVQSMWSGSFAAPAGLWLLSYFAASSVPETGRGVNVPLRWKPALCAASLGGGAGLAWAAARGLVLAWR